MRARPYQTDRRTSTGRTRQGSATVELAVILPVFLTLLLGLVEMSYALNATHTLQGALRDAGRLASMDYEQIFGSGFNPNTKIPQDIRNLLTAAGIPGDKVTIKVVHSGGSDDGAAFDLANDNNYLKMFRIEASVPYSVVSALPTEFMTGQNITASVTFRKGRVSLTTN